MEDSLTSLMQLDVAMEKFIEMYANSFIKWEAVQFFYDHPNTKFKLEEIARNLNRPSKELKKELQELNEAEFIREVKTAKSLAYSYAPGSDSKAMELQAIVERFVRICQEREGRLRVVYKLLKNGKPITH